MLFSIRSYTTYNKKTCDICAILSCNLNNLSLINNMGDRMFLRGKSNLPALYITPFTTLLPVTPFSVYPFSLCCVVPRYGTTLRYVTQKNIVVVCWLGIIIIPSLIYTLVPNPNKKTNTTTPTTLNHTMSCPPKIL